MGIGGREFSVGRLEDCRVPFTDSTMAALDLRMNLIMQTHGKQAENFTPPKKHLGVHRSPATACNSRRHAMKRVPCVGPYCPDSIDPGFVEIGLVQLSPSVKTTTVTHTRAHIPTHKLNNGTLYAPRYEEAFLPKGKERPRSLRSLGLTSF